MALFDIAPGAETEADKPVPSVLAESDGKENLSTVEKKGAPVVPPPMYPATPELAIPVKKYLAVEIPVPRLLRVSPGKANFSTEVREELPIPPPAYPATPEFAKPASARRAVASPVPRVDLVSDGKANLSTVVTSTVV
jgi:hypothetical protein